MLQHACGLPSSFTWVPGFKMSSHTQDQTCTTNLLPTEPSYGFLIHAITTNIISESLHLFLSMKRNMICDIFKRLYQAESSVSSMYHKQKIIRYKINLADKIAM